MSSLHELALLHGTDKAAHGYCPHYERHLGHLRDVPFTLVEVGVADGASLRMWRDYFPHARVVGYDRNPATMIEGEDRITTYCDDASIPRPWRSLGDLPSLAPLVIVDDGSHGAEEIVGAWTWTWPLLAPGGWYVVEDLATQFCVEFGGSDEGSVATDLLAVLMRRALRAEEVAEFHVYRELALVRKA